MIEVDASNSACIAPFVLLRVAGLALDDLVDLAPPETTACIENAVAAATLAELMRPLAERAVHDSFALLDGRSRLAAIELRRMIHRSKAIDEDLLAPVRSVMPVELAKPLDQWLVARRIAEEGMRAADAAYSEELNSHLRAKLCTLFRNEAFLRPLVIASRSLFVRASCEVERVTASLRATKLERSLLAYLIRASAKTSPFSTFMHLALMHADATAHSPPTLRAADRISRTSLNRRLVFELHGAAFGRWPDDQYPSYRMSPTVNWVHGQVLLAMAPWYGQVEDRILRLTRGVRLNLPAMVGLCLSRLPDEISRSELIARLVDAGLSEEAAERLSIRLRKAGVVELIPWTDGFDSHPELGSGPPLRDRTGSSMAIAHHLVRMGEVAGAVSTASSQDRVRLLEAIDADLDVLSQGFGDAPVAMRTAVLEHGFFSHPVGGIGSALRGILLDVARCLEPMLEWSASYLALRDLYTHLYGADGCCYDVVDFMGRASAMFADAGHRLPPRSPTRVSPTPDRPRVPLSVFLQVLGNPSETAVKPVAVVNHVHAGCGWLSARHAEGDQPFHAELREGLRTWLSTLAAPAEPVDILISGDCNPLQAHPRLTAQVLRCPLEPCRDRSALSLRDVWLKGNPGSGCLEMFAGTEKLAPFYLGSTFPNPGWGPLYWLIVLAMPWDCAVPERSIERVEAGTDVTHTARQSSGRVLLNRATWSMAAERMRRVWFRRLGTWRLFDIATDCENLGIPRFFFVRCSQSASGPTVSHKPMWIDARNPFVLDVLEHSVRRAERLVIVEALPDRPRWPAIDGKAHVSELQVEFAI